MSTFKKFYDRLKRTPKDITFDELHNFLTSDKIGWSFRVNGSHHIYQDEMSIDVVTIPKHNIPVKPYYIKRVVEILIERENELYGKK